MAGSENKNKVIPVDIVREMKDSYIDYAMSVIVARALPDARDGLKPVHRRILYAMHKLGLSAATKPRKSATVVGEVLGKYHPHGDAVVYDALVRLAQDFALRYPLVQGQGNFGSIDGDAAAAMRYTEARLSKLSAEMLRDLEKETVPFVPNYDGVEKEPEVLPAAIPQLLLNGTVGIAVGMATKIPPHNLIELTLALEKLLEKPKVDLDELLALVQGPDFPTGGLVYNKHDIRHAYATGRGGVLCRGLAEVVETKTGQHSIVISSIPYQVNKASLIVAIADLIRDKKLEGVRDLRDESAKGEIRIVVELKSGVQPQKILNALYKRTELETTFHFNMISLVDGVPRLLPLKGLLEVFLNHRRVVITNRTRFDLKEAEARAHILEGLKKALDHIDEIIKTIKRSNDVPAAHSALRQKFGLSELQATAILEMKLQKLAGLERKKIEEELKEKLALIKDLREILQKPERVRKIIKAELAEIRKNYGDERRTKIIKGGVKEINEADLVPEKENILILTAGGYIKRTDPAEYRAQKRGGIGVVDLDVKEEDFVTVFLTANTHADLLFFTDRGKVYQIKMYDLPEGKRSTRGKSIMNFLSLSADERVTSVLALPPGMKKAGPSLLMVTKQGIAKKVKAGSFQDVRLSGLVAIKLKANDELLAVCPVDKGSEIILASAKGQAIRFKESDIREMGRTAAGVKAMRLSAADEVIGAQGVAPDQKGELYLVVSRNGYGKKTKLKEYKTQKRGGSGIKTFKVTAKSGRLIASRVVTAEMEELIAISKQSQVIRTKLSEIPVLGRATQGVRLMKLRPGDELASITSL